MAVIDDILASLTAGQPTNDCLLINRDTRTITIPTTESVFGVLEDDSSETKYFGIERTPTSSIDLADCAIYVVYALEDSAGDITSGISGPITSKYNSTMLVFGWTIPEAVCSKVGTLSFNVHFHSASGPKWHSGIAYAQILNGYAYSITNDLDDGSAAAKTLSEELEAEIQALSAKLTSEINRATTKEEAIVTDIEYITNTIPITSWTDWSYNYMNLAGTTPVQTTSSSTKWQYAILDCTKGDVFIINSKGGSAARAWAYTNSDGTIIQRAASGDEAVNLYSIAPEGATKLYINRRHDDENNSYIGRLAGKRINDVEEYIGLTLINNWLTDKCYYLDGISITIGSPSTSSTGFRCALVPCEPGDIFTVNGTGGSRARLWAFVDSSGNILSVANRGAFSNLTLTAPEDAGYLVLNDNSNSKCYYGKLSDELKSEIVSLLGSTPFIPYSMSKWIKGESISGSVSGTTSETYNAWGETIVDSSENWSRSIAGYATLADGGDDETRPIYIYEHTNPFSKYVSKADYNSSNKQPLIMLVSGVHGGEKASIYATFTFMEQLESNEDLSELCDNFRFVVIPMANPWAVDNTPSDSTNARGVNINRNFEMFWDSYSGSTKGSAPLSENESIIINDAMDSYKPDLYVDYHNCSGTNDYGHSLTFDKKLQQVTMSVFNVGIRNFSRYPQAEASGGGTWVYNGQNASLPIVGEKKEPETYAQAWSKGIAAVLFESPIRDSAQADTTANTRGVMIYGYERLLNMLTSCAEQLS